MNKNQIIQTTIEGMKEITQYDFAVMDREGSVLAQTFRDANKLSVQSHQFAETTSECISEDGHLFLRVLENGETEFVVVVMGRGDHAEEIGRILVFHMKELMEANNERFDRDNFIKNLLLDNLLLVDIYNRAKKLHIESEAKRVVIVVENPKERKGDELEKVKTVLSANTKDFVTAVDESNIIVVKDLTEPGAEESIQKTAEEILNALDNKTRVAYGTTVNELKDVSKSYKEATMALDVGKIFFKEKNIIAYSVLGIGRLIYQLPIPLCKMFIQEIFDKKSPEDFDEETLTTINKFFENSLNVSETSRQLYIHRNTLVYRLDKIQKMTGLDLRIFDDAITFKIALMVVEYMDYMESQDNTF